MKQNPFYDALDGVDPALIARAEKKPPRSGGIKWLSAIAATLALVMIFGAVIGVLYRKPLFPFQKTPYSDYALSAAVFPTMANYPTDPNDHESFLAWRNDVSKQNTFGGRGRDLTAFFEKTACELLQDADGQNLVYSPLNIYLALAVAAECADGATRAELLSLLGVNSIETLRSKTHAIWNANYRDDGIVKSLLANSLWLSDDGNYHESTVKLLAETYYASVFSGDMANADYSNAMRTWINDMTGNLLKNEVNSLEFDPDTLFAIVSTLYFSAKWEHFREDRTEEKTFHAETGDITCDFMQTTLGEVYYWGEIFSAVSLSLEHGGKLWMILPDEGYTPDDLLTNREALSFLTAYDRNQWENRKGVTVHLALPKFKISSQLDLVKSLKKLGATSCFDPNSADFSTISDIPSFIGSIDHGCTIAVDEDGIIGAAYTVIANAGAAEPPDDTVTFTLDRPFLFVVTSTDNLPLFTGVVNQPN